MAINMINAFWECPTQALFSKDDILMIVDMQYVAHVENLSSLNLSMYAHTCIQSPWHELSPWINLHTQEHHVHTYFHRQGVQLVQFSMLC